MVRNDPKSFANCMAFFLEILELKIVRSFLIKYSMVCCRKVKLDENVANVWPEFGTNGKDQIKV